MPLTNRFGEDEDVCPDSESPRNRVTPGEVVALKSADSDMVWDVQGELVPFLVNLFLFAVRNQSLPFYMYGVPVSISSSWVDS